MDGALQYAGEPLLVVVGAGDGGVPGALVGEVRLEDPGGGRGQEVLVDDGVGAHPASVEEAREILRRAAAVAGAALFRLVAEERLFLDGQLVLGTREAAGPDFGRFADQLVVEGASRPGERDAACLDLAETDPQGTGRDTAVRFAEPAGLGQRPERRLAKQHIRAFPARRALDPVDHRDAALRHPAVELVDVEYAGGEVVDVSAGDAADVGGDGGDPLQFRVPGTVHGLG